MYKFSKCHCQCCRKWLNSYYRFINHEQLHRLKQYSENISAILAKACGVTLCRFILLIVLNNIAHNEQNKRQAMWMFMCLDSRIPFSKYNSHKKQAMLPINFTESFVKTVMCLNCMFINATYIFSLRVTRWTQQMRTNMYIHMSWKQTISSKSICTW